jgi:hypothetical protein
LIGRKYREVLIIFPPIKKFFRLCFSFLSPEVVKFIVVEGGTKGMEGMEGGDGRRLEGANLAHPALG